MKKLVLSVSALMLMSLAELPAQITNANFEVWHSDYVAPNTNDPNACGNGCSGWWDFNFTNEGFIFGSSPVTVFEGNSNPAPEDSSHYAVIVSKRMGDTAYNYMKGFGVPYPQINGIIITAYVDIVPSNYPNNVLTFNPGMSFNQKIGTLSFWYRYIPNGTDTCSCSVVLSHYSNGASHIIGGGLWTNHDTVTSWKQATVQITYDSVNSTPDTILIQFSACSLYKNPKAGDTMNVDNVGTSPYLGIDNMNAPHDNVNLYPNPAQTEVTLAITGNYQANRAEVYDITGKAVGTYSVTNNSLTINTQSYSSGLYIYKLFDNTGIQLNVGKFSVVQ